jgi:hypothetical protein
MTRFALSAVLILGLGGPLLAQTAPAPRDAPVSQPRAPINTGPLENGANSFTEEQAAQRLRDAGISDLSGVTKDANGIWRARGQWMGKAVTVGLDYRGAIVAE